MERTNVCLWQIRERIKAGAKLLEVAAIRIAYGLLLGIPHELLEFAGWVIVI
jgi:hypothetical protein